MAKKYYEFEIDVNSIRVTMVKKVRHFFKRNEEILITCELSDFMGLFGFAEIVMCADSSSVYRVSEELTKEEVDNISSKITEKFAKNLKKAGKLQLNKEKGEEIDFDINIKSTYLADMPIKKLMKVATTADLFDEFGEMFVRSVLMKGDK